MAEAGKTKITIMVSSTVYGMEDQLTQLFGLLQGYGYRVWMSHMGTLPVMPGQSAFESCLAAVESCDIFFGLIRPQYGSGQATSEEKSITHRELSRAIELVKPRFFIADKTVVSARRLLLDLGFKGPEGRAGLELRKGATPIDDLRVIDMYEEAIQDELVVGERVDNWVQPYSSWDDILRYVEEQFDRYKEMAEFLKTPPQHGEKEVSE